MPLSVMPLQRFELAPLANRFLSELSGGQRQRALIATTFCQETDHVLLDEPLNNLDMFHARTHVYYVNSLMNLR